MADILVVKVNAFLRGKEMDELTKYIHKVHGNRTGYASTLLRCPNCPRQC